MTDRYFIGLMSGTSMDAVDAVLCQDQNDNFTSLDSASSSYSEQLKTQLTALTAGSKISAQAFGQLQQSVTDCFLQACIKLTQKHCEKKISAIGSHGQTIWHQPEGGNGFSLQLNDGGMLAVKSGVPVVCDFRNADIALGGQGAPLVPPFHQQVFSHTQERRMAVNLGGIANITILTPNSELLGYDLGPANCLMDAWCKQHLKQPFDHDGEWAASGTINQALLEQLLKFDFFSQVAPKSTGLETFNLAWLKEQLAQEHVNHSTADIQATLAELTAELITQEAKTHNCQQLIICGGGAKNKHLMGRLKNLNRNRKVVTSSHYGISPQDVEGAAFAWLAMRRLDALPSSAVSVTGAKKTASLGGLYLP